jgi:hypothetical protein
MAKNTFLFIFVFLSTTAIVFGELGSAFTYQGRLKQSGRPAEGVFDLSFELFADDTGTSTLGTVCIDNITVTNGLFAIELDFGVGAFVGAKRWLEISARADSGDACDANTGTFTTLSPLQQITPAPQAHYAREAGTLIGGINDPDADPKNELNTTLSLNGTVLQLSDAGGTITADLSSLQDGIGTDNQTLSFSSPTLSIEDGNLVDLSSLQDGVTDPDADPTNEYNTSLILSKNNLQLSDAGGTLTVDLSLLASHSLDSVDGSKTDVVFVDEVGQVGIGTSSPTELLNIDNGNIQQTPGDPVLVGSLPIGLGSRSVYVSGSYAYVVDILSNDLKVIDVSDPINPSLVGSLVIGGFPWSIYVSGRHAYIVDQVSEDLKVIDISDPTSPVVAGSLEIGGIPWSVYVSGRNAYVVDGSSDDLKVIDVSDPSSPSLAGSLSIGPEPLSVFVSGRYAYVVDSTSSDLKVIDISDSSSPMLAGSLDIDSAPRAVYVSGRYAYVINFGSGDLKCIDISNPAYPALAGSLEIGENPRSIYVSGRYAYVVDGDSADLKMIDVSDSSSPILIGSLFIGGDPRSVSVSGRFAYVVRGFSADLKVIDVSGGEMTSLIAHSLEAGNLQVRNDIIAQGQLQITGGITAGAGGIFSDGDVGIAGDLKTTGTVEAFKFIGDGSMLLGITDNVDDADADPMNELLIGASLNSTTLEISDVGGTITVNLASLQDGVTDADDDPANELQNLTFVSPNLFISNGAGVDLSSLIDSATDGHSLDASDGSTTDAVFVDTAGNVGIGTTKPSEILTIEGGNILQKLGDPEMVGSLSIVGSPRSVYVSGRYAYIVESELGQLKVIDVSDPTSPTLTGSLSIGSSPHSVYVSGRYAYVIDVGSDDLKVIDVSNPSSPRLTGSLGIGASPQSIYVSGHYAYIVDQFSDDLKVIDVSNPVAPALIGSFTIGGAPRSVYVSGRYAYVVESDFDELKVIDVSDPTFPALTGSLSIGRVPASVYVSGRYAYIVDAGSEDLKVIDISNPASPTLVGSLGIGRQPLSVYVSGRYAYVVDGLSDDLKMIDISNPASPTLIGFLGVGRDPRSVYVSGRYAYIVDTLSDDLKVIDISGGEITSLLAHSLEAGNLQVRNDVILQGQLQVAGGITAGVGGIFSDGDVGVSGDLKTTGTVEAYKFVGDGSMLTGIPGSTDDQTLSFNSPNLSIENGNVVDLSAMMSGGFGDGHSLDAVDGSTTDVVFVDNNGQVGIGTTTPGAVLDIHAQSVSSTLSLSEIGVVLDDGQGGTFTSLSDAIGVFVSGSTAYVASRDDDALTIIDVSNPTAPVELGVAIDDSQGGTFSRLEGAHSVFVTETTAYVTSFFDDAFTIIDVSNPAVPVELGVALDDSQGGTFSRLNGAQGVFVVGTVAYVTANTDRALTIIDVSNPAAPVELGVALDDSQGGTFSSLETASGLFVSDLKAYVTSPVADALSIIDVSNPSSPVELGLALDDNRGGVFSRLDGANDIYVSGSTAYVTSLFDDALTVIDVSNPSVPIELGVALDDSQGGIFTSLNSAQGVFISGTIAYVTSSIDSALTAVDISDPSELVELEIVVDDSQGGTFTNLASPLKVFVDDTTAYVTSISDDALTIVDVVLPEPPIGLRVAGDAEFNQDVTLTGGTITANKFIGDGSMLTGISDNVIDSDADSSNELNTSLVLNGLNLELIDAGGTLTVNLSPIASMIQEGMIGQPLVYTEGSDGSTLTNNPILDKSIVEQLRQKEAKIQQLTIDRDAQQKQIDQLRQELHELKELLLITAD